MNGQLSVNIIGAGLAGLSAAITLAREGVESRLISLLPSERSQSVLAEGGINGALNTMGEDDSPQEHFADTMKAGVYIADPEAVRGLAEHAPEILMEFKRLGVAFNLQREQIQQRNFGGQKKKRTAYARSSTGKVLMTALIDEARKYESAGLIQRYPHHELARLVVAECGGTEKENGEHIRKRCFGVLIRDTYTAELSSFSGPVILAAGGMNGMFPEITTGTVTNSGDAAALAFAQGVHFSNLEMIQYHPTTIGIAGKRCLISEAARGEGGRLFVLQDGKPYFFMEEKYPELGNLMPRDVVSREMYFVAHNHPDGGKERQVCLDMRHLPAETWEKKLPDLRSEIIHYLRIDPAKEPVPVNPGIHYFMGGIDVNVRHETNIAGLYAAGECCSQYHGANRLGGNSTMGAVYGGRVAAQSLIKSGLLSEEQMPEPKWNTLLREQRESLCLKEPAAPGEEELNRRIRDILSGALGIVRNEEDLKTAIRELKNLMQSRTFRVRENNRLMLALAMLMSAQFRKESRGAHYRSDYPQTEDAFCGRTMAERSTGEIKIGLQTERSFS